MSTEHALFHDPKRRTELTCYEMSGQFSLSAAACDDSGVYITELHLSEKLSPDDLASIALRMIKCSSYNGLSNEKIREIKNIVDEILSEREIL